MKFNQSGNISRAIILALIGLTLIAYLIKSNNKRIKESEPRMQQCQAQCLAQDSYGYEFEWGIFGGPKCKCISSK